MIRCGPPRALIDRDATVVDAAAVPHPHPTMSEVFSRVAEDLTRTNFVVNEGEAVAVWALSRGKSHARVDSPHSPRRQAADLRRWVNRLLRRRTTPGVRKLVF
jgi:hypothetical protein